MLIYDFFLFVCPLPWKPPSIFWRENRQKINDFFLFKLNVSWIKLLVAQMHLYMSINNHKCRCGKRKNEFDIYFVSIMCIKSGWGNQI